MSGLLICAAGAFLVAVWALALQPSERVLRGAATLGLALIAAALYLAWRAGGAGA